MTPEPQTPPEVPDEPVVRDKRRIDPETGQVRTPSGATSPEEQVPAGAEGDVPSAGPAPEGAGDGVADGTLAAAKAEAADLAEQLARRNADLYNLEQEYNGYVRRSKSAAVEQQQAGVVAVAEALMGVLDDIDLARAHGDLTGPFAAIAEKLEAVLAQRFDVTRYGAVGEEFDPVVHEALMHSTDAEATGTTVSQVLQPGYRVGERVLRAARVAVTGPE
ncbi:nucleotide exchange factor GrpE [Georgenia wangjunii]|uniref:nucleotide exchange factor GrpE n=1 Tax=Georgenia wangjunii TaxID=3117730 RepID=UPI002F263E6A